MTRDGRYGPRFTSALLPRSRPAGQSYCRAHPQRRNDNHQKQEPTSSHHFKLLRYLGCVVVRDVLVEEIAHRVDEDDPRLFPLQRVLEAAGPEPEVERLFGLNLRARRSSLMAASSEESRWAPPARASAWIAGPSQLWSLKPIPYGGVAHNRVHRRVWQLMARRAREEVSQRARLSGKFTHFAT